MLVSVLSLGSGSKVHVQVRVKVRFRVNPNINLRYLQYLTMGSFWTLAAAKLRYSIQPPKSNVNDI